MTRDMLKRTGMVAGSLVFAASGIMAATPALAHETAWDRATTDIAEMQSVEQAIDAEQTADALRTVRGDFSFTQTKLSSASDLKVFSRAAATLCQSLPLYDDGSAIEIAVTGPNGSLAAAVADAAEESPQSYIMACSCASNVAGGGAMANAEVSGIPLATLASLIS